HRGNDKRDHLLVAAPWTREAAGEDCLIHEGWRSDLQCRLLQGITRRARMSAYGTKPTWSRVASVLSSLGSGNHAITGAVTYGAAVSTDRETLCGAMKRFRVVSTKCSY